jgi:hypothetical protein
VAPNGRHVFADVAFGERAPVVGWYELDEPMPGLARGIAFNVDAAVFAQMSSEDVRLVREAIGGDASVAASVDRDDLDPIESDVADLALEQEIARLEDELSSSRRLQGALERYLELLSARTTAV